MKRKTTLLCLGILMATVSFGQTKPKEPKKPSEPPQPPTVVVKDIKLEKEVEVTPPPPPPPPPKKIHVKRNTKPAKIVVPPKPPVPPAKPKKEMKEVI